MRGRVRVECLEGVRDLVAPARAGPGRARHAHRQAALDERVREGGQEVLVGDRAGVAQDRFGAGAGDRQGQAVDGLAGDLVGELPVGGGREVGEGVADARAQLRGGARPM
ncbi:hypothetical protein GCM10029992_05900 [Glycomyces albus]